MSRRRSAAIKVYTLDEEALVLQRRLEDEASHEAIRAATSLRNKSRGTMVALEDTRAKLRQQLAVAERQLAQAATDSETHNRAVAVAEHPSRAIEASRRQTQPSGTPAPQRVASPDRAFTQTSILSTDYRALRTSSNS